MKIKELFFVVSFFLLIFNKNICAQMGYNSWSEYASDVTARSMAAYEAQRMSDEGLRPGPEHVPSSENEGAGLIEITDAGARAVLLATLLGGIIYGAEGGVKAGGISMFCAWIFGGCGYSYASKYRGNNLSFYSEERSILLGPVTKRYLELTNVEDRYYFKMPNGNLDVQEINFSRIGLSFNPAYLSESSNSVIKNFKLGYLPKELGFKIGGGWYIGMEVGNETTTVGLDYLKTSVDRSYFDYPDYKFEKKRIEGKFEYIFGGEEKKIVTSLTLHKENVVSKKTSSGLLLPVNDVDMNLKDKGIKIGVRPYLTHNFYLEGLLGLGKNSGTWVVFPSAKDYFPIKQSYKEISASMGLSTRVLDTSLGYIQTSQQRWIGWRTSLNYRGDGWGIVTGFTLGYVLKDGIVPFHRLHESKNWMIPSFLVRDGI